MIAVSAAIVLRVHPFSRTSHVVTWLSPQFGRLVTSVKGACRPKSAFLGQYDLGYTCELLFYRREHGGVHVARECTPLRLRELLRTNWRAAAAAAYICDLAARVTQPQLAAPEVFELLESALDRLAVEPHPTNTVISCELALLKHAGLMPNLTPCAACPDGDAAACRFALVSGRPVCRHTSPASPGEATVAVPPGVLRSLREQSAFPDTTVPVWQDNPNLALGLRRFLGIFIQCHLDVPPAVRRTAFEWMELDLAALEGPRRRSTGEIP